MASTLIGTELYLRCEAYHGALAHFGVLLIADTCVEHYSVEQKPLNS